MHWYVFWYKCQKKNTFVMTEWCFVTVLINGRFAIKNKCNTTRFRYMYYKNNTWGDKVDFISTLPSGKETMNIFLVELLAPLQCVLYVIRQFFVFEKHMYLASKKIWENVRIYTEDLLLTVRIKYSISQNTMTTLKTKLKI